jgi:hypothetical protein
MAVTTLTPAAVKVATEYNYLNSLDIENGLHKPEQDSQYVMRYGRQDATGLMELLGNKKAVNNPKFSHYEQERIHGVVRLSASAASASGSGVTLAGTAAAAYTYTYSGQSPYPTTDSFSANVLQANDVIEVNGFTMLVTAVAGNAFSAISYDSSATRPAITATDDIIIKGQASPEGSGAPDSRNSRVISYTNFLQIMRRSHRVTGTEMGTKTWIEVEGKDGKKGYFWYLQGIKDEYDRFMNEREATLMTGQDFQNNLAGLAGIGASSYGDADSTTFTKGLIPQISADGNVEAYSAGSLALTDVENVVKNLQKNRGSRENMLYCGHNFKLDVDALIREDANLKNGGIQFAAFQGVENQDVRYSIDAFEYGGFKFGLKVLDIFSDPNFLGYAGGIYNELGIVVPLDDVVTYNSMNAGSSAMVPSIQICYMDTDDGSREYKEWVTGLGMGVANQATDYFDVHFLSHVGLEASALNRFALFVG